MFIVLEGLDASGKTTVADFLAERLGGIVYKTPPKKYLLLRDEIDAKPGTYEHYQFYRDAVIEAGKEIKDLLSQGKTVICDRYWFSTIVYHRVGNLDVDRDDFSDLIQPDLTVFLFVSPATQIERSAGRKDESKGDVSGFQDRINVEFFKEISESRLPFLIINTDNIKPSHSVGVITSAINSGG